MKTHACGINKCHQNEISCTFIITVFNLGSKQTKKQTTIVHQMKLVIYKVTHNFTQKEASRSWC